MLNDTFSNLLHESACKWGLSVPEDRPLIDDDTNPYPRPTVVEIFTWRGERPWHHAEIELVTLNGQWSYTYNYSVTDRGGGFGPLLKFCDPYPTRDAALTAAIAALRKHDHKREMRSWLDELSRPKQLSMW